MPNRLLSKTKIKELLMKSAGIDPVKAACASRLSGAIHQLEESLEEATEDTRMRNKLAKERKDAE